MTIMTKKYAVWGGALLLMILGGLAYFYTFYEKESYPHRIPPSYEARNKTFYVAEKFLKAQGINAISTKHRRKLIDLPETTSALFVPGDSLSEKEVENLMSWVEKGGRLFLFADSDEAWQEDQLSENPIMRELNVKVVHSKELFPDMAYDYDKFIVHYWMECLNDKHCNTLESPDEHESAPSEAEGSNTTPPTDDKDIYAFDENREADMVDKMYYSITQSERVNGRPHPYGLKEGVRINVDKQYSLKVYEGQADVVFQSEQTVGGLQFYRGKGVITIFNNYEFLSHDVYELADRFIDKADVPIKITGNHIGRYDHAYFLLESVKDRSAVWFFESMEHIGFFKLSLQKIPYFLLTLFIGVVLFLFWVSSRLGPFLESVKQPRRSVLEHLHMSGSFDWRVDKCETLLTKNQKELLSLMHKKYPKTKRLDKTNGVAYLSERLGLDEKQVYTALYSNIETEKQFITITQSIQILRNAL